MTASIPSWLLALFYWIHMIATTAWLGGLAIIVLWIYPPEKAAIRAGQYAALTVASARRVNRIAWFALVVLGVSGLFQMSANSQYQGVLVIENIWSVIIFIKHIVILVMALVTLWLTYRELPRIHMIQLRAAAAKTGTPDRLRHAQTRLVALLRLNLVLGIIVLGLTALARIQ